jgi:hypothetical protein
MTVSFDPTSFSNRVAKIKDAMENPDKNIRVTEYLEIVDKENGFVRFLKIVFLPLARMFGADPFTHTRAHKVALALFNEYKKHANDLSKDDVQKIRYIISYLNDNTKNKRYESTINLVLAMLPEDDGSQIKKLDSKPFTPPVAPPAPPLKPSSKAPLKTLATTDDAKKLFAEINKGKSGFQLKKVDPNLINDTSAPKKGTAGGQNPLFAALQKKILPKSEATEESDLDFDAKRTDGKTTPSKPPGTVNFAEEALKVKLKHVSNKNTQPVIEQPKEEIKPPVVATTKPVPTKKTAPTKKPAQNVEPEVFDPGKFDPQAIKMNLKPTTPKTAEIKTEDASKNPGIFFGVTLKPTENK